MPKKYKLLKITIVDSFDENGLLELNGSSIEGWDEFGFERRNREALSMKMESIGKIWKEGKVGEIYEDKTYFIEPNFGWLKGITGSQNIKSLISGIGIKVVDVKGDHIIAGNKSISWKNLRSNPNWLKKHGEGQDSKSRTVRVQRVAYLKTRSKSGKEKIVEFSDNVCTRKLSDNGKPNAYLIIGFTEVGEDKGSGQKRIKWGLDDHFYTKGKGDCKWLKGVGRKSLDISIDRYWNNGGRVGVWGQSLIALGYGKGIRVFSHSNNKNVVAIVLGVAVKKERWDSGQNKWVDDGTWEDQKWVSRLKERGGCDRLKGECYELNSHGEDNWNSNVESISDWKLNQTLTYKY